MAALALVLAASTAIVVEASPAAADSAPSGPYVTVLLGRSMWAQSEGGVAVAGQPTLNDLAVLFAQRGVKATGVVTPGRTAETGIQNINGNLYPSWATLGSLRDTYGWSFVSNGQNRVDITSLPPAEQQAESCGSLTAFTQHGHLRAWGMYGPGSNRITDAIATNLIATCFAFTRLYDGTSLNSRNAVTKPPYYARTNDTSGGKCNSATCSGNAGISDRYMLPSKMIADLQQAGTDQWVILSTYKLLTGTKQTGGRRWDCSAADPAKHWTSEVESYCLNDFLSALDAIKPGSIVTDPAGVAQAWDRSPGQPPTSNVEPNSTVTVPAPGATLTSPLALSGSATDDHGVSSVYVAVRDQATTLWLQPNGGWGGFTMYPTQLSSPGGTATSWSYGLSLGAGSYGLSVRAVDSNGVTETSQPWVLFSVAGATNVEPNSTVTVPAPGATLTSPLALSGSATDDHGVSSVYVAVRDQATKLWLQSNGGWGDFQMYAAQLSNPGGTSTSWSYGLSLRAGSYGLSVRAVDSNGVTETTQPWVLFAVRS